jgi:hypothetical protein
MMESEKSGNSEAGICHSFPKKRKIDFKDNQCPKKDFSCRINMVNT